MATGLKLYDATPLASLNEAAGQGAAFALASEGRNYKFNASALKIALDGLQSLIAALQNSQAGSQTDIAEMKPKVLANSEAISLLEQASGEIQTAIAALSGNVASHITDTDNPHDVSKTQIGLGDVDNVQQAAKADFEAHIADAVKHITSGERTAWNAKYGKPDGGIPAADLESAVQDSLGKAETALQDASAFATAAQGALAEAALPMPGGDSTQFIDGTGALQAIPAGLGGGYSTTEVDTGNVWINGKPIYRRVFTGTITAAANTWTAVQMLNSVANIVTRVSGWYQYNTASNSWIDYGTYHINYGSSDRSILSSAFYGGNFSSISRYQRTNAPYHIIVEYVKP